MTKVEEDNDLGDERMEMGEGIGDGQGCEGRRGEGRGERMGKQPCGGQFPRPLTSQ